MFGLPTSSLMQDGHEARDHPAGSSTGHQTWTTSSDKFSANRWSSEKQDCTWSQAKHDGAAIGLAEQQQGCWCVVFVTVSSICSHAAVHPSFCQAGSPASVEVGCLHHAGSWHPQVRQGLHFPCKGHFVPCCTSHALLSRCACACVFALLSAQTHMTKR